VKWAQPIRDEVTAHLVQLGLAKCPICDGEVLGVNDKPVLLMVGGVGWPTAGLGGEKDPDANVEFMIQVECNLCGYNLLFNSERFRGGDMPAFVR
jgi:hypothetical protein